MGGWWWWTLVSQDGVAPTQMVSVSASVNLPLHHKVQKFSSGTGSPGWFQTKGRKTVVVVVLMNFLFKFIHKNHNLAHVKICFLSIGSSQYINHHHYGFTLSSYADSNSRTIQVLVKFYLVTF